MVIVGVLQLDGHLDPTSLRELLGERLLIHERFIQRVDRSAARPVWERDLDFDITHHVRVIQTPADEKLFADRVASFMVEPLNPDRPLWEILVVPAYAGGTALLVKLHHAIADGIALLQILLTMADDVEAADLRRPRIPSQRSPVARLWTRISQPFRLLGAAFRLAALPPDPRSALKSDLSGIKDVAWSDLHDLEAISTASRHLGATVNDVLLASVSGAISDVLAKTGRKVHREIRAMVPFNLRPPEVGRPLGNRFGLVLPALPVSQPNPLRRLDRVRERMTQIKRRPEAAAAYTILGLAGISSEAVESLIVKFFGTKVSLVLTNVPGPDEHISLGGHRVDRIMFWVPQAARLGLGISLLSYAGSVTVGVVADQGLAIDAGDVVDEIQRELSRYLDIGTAAGPRPFSPLI